MSTPVITRFAPSPTGHLHLGHALAAIEAFDMAMERGGRFLLRMEDIDVGRAKPEFEEAIYEDLEWLGLSWESPVRRQSEHMDDYAGALATLDEMGLLYPCFCTRKEIMAEIEQSRTAPHLLNQGPDGPPYPGTCLNMDAHEVKNKESENAPYALRLNMKKAMAVVGEMSPLKWPALTWPALTWPTLTWIDKNKGEITAQPEIFGDVVLARKDVPTSYHLAVTLDDHLQGVTLVSRGKDLFAATHLHRLLQALLSLDTPVYAHHNMMKNEDGSRMSKREKSMTLKSLRESGHKPSDIKELVHKNELYTND